VEPQYRAGLGGIQSLQGDIVGILRRSNREFARQHNLVRRHRAAARGHLLLRYHRIRYLGQREHSIARVARDRVTVSPGVFVRSRLAYCTS
jgi:hypothetical protein